MKKIIVGLVAGAGLALVGCGGGFSCSSKGPCSNDPAPTSAETTACNNAESGPCGSQYKDLGNCVYTNSKCTSAGVSDSSGAFSISVAADGGIAVTGTCATQFSAMTACCTSNSGAAGCTAG